MFGIVHSDDALVLGSDETDPIHIRGRIVQHLALLQGKKKKVLCVQVGNTWGIVSHVVDGDAHRIARRVVRDLFPQYFYGLPAD